MASSSVQLTFNLSKYMGDQFKLPENKNRDVTELIPSTEYLSEFAKEIHEILEENHTYRGKFRIPNSYVDVKIVKKDEQKTVDHKYEPNIYVELIDTFKDDDEFNQFIQFFNRNIYPISPYSRVKRIVFADEYSPESLN